jgi:type IV pilus assembly protein PilE
MKKNLGFSLLELMLAVAIAGILMSFALPVYTQYFMHAKRLEAEVEMMKLAAALERYFVVNDSYAGATLEKLNFPAEIAGGRYLLKIGASDDNFFIVRAEPLGKQIDEPCAALVINSRGEKSVTGSEKVDDCW